MSRSSDDLKTVVAALPAAQLPHLLDLMCIQHGGNATVRRQRILTAISGRPARQRSGWLDFFRHRLGGLWRAITVIIGMSFLWIDIDVSESWTTRITGTTSTPEFWISYLGNIRDVTAQPLPKFLPFDLLADLEYDSDGDPVRFRNFTWRLA